MDTLKHVTLGEERADRCRWFGILIVGCALACASGCGKRGDRVLETWEATNQHVKIRVRKFDEKQPNLANYYFSIESAIPASTDWREILIWKSDNLEVPRDQVQFVSDQVVYAFGGQTYAVTTDAGRTWSSWNAVKNLPGLKSPWISRVHVSGGGAGTMILAVSPSPEQVSLQTTDYGAHWAR